MTEHYNLSLDPPQGVRTTLVVDVFHKPDGLRVYVGARWKNTYLIIPDTESEAQTVFTNAWESYGKQSLWLSPAPYPDQLLCDEPDRRDGATNKRKAKRRRNRG